MLNSFVTMISESKFVNAVKKFFVSLSSNSHVQNATESANSYAKSASAPNPFDTFGHYIADKVKKIFKKFGKKFKNEAAATNTIAKIANVMLKVVCVAATLAFAALVIYTLIKLLPAIIMVCAAFTALYIGVNLTTAVLSRGMGIE